MDLLAGYGSDEDSGNEESSHVNSLQSASLSFDAQKNFDSSSKAENLSSNSGETASVRLWPSLSPKKPPASRNSTGDLKFSMGLPPPVSTHRDFSTSRFGGANDFGVKAESKKFPENPVIDSDILSGSSSIFSALPQPKSKSVYGDVKPKKTVAFKPPIDVNYLLNSLDEDEEPAKKKVKTAGSGEKSGGGILSFLPAPRNVSSSIPALGSGSHLSTKRVDLNDNSPATAAPAPPSSSTTTGVATFVADDHSAVSSSETCNISYSAHGSHDHSQYPSAHPQHHVSESYGSVGNVNTTEGYTRYQSPAYSMGHDATHASQQQNEAHQPHSFSVASGTSSNCPRSSSGETLYNYVAHNEYYGDYPFTAQGNHYSAAADPLQQMLACEKRHGKDLPTQFVEIKQSELTNKGNLREDQVRSTGIAFGPSYQPISSEKGKPSKLHKRKHQIGSLYFDMKQKEAELLERRSRGMLTKSETQAKYGW